MHRIVSDLRDKLTEITLLHRTLFLQLRSTEEAVKTGTLSSETALVDAAYLMREMSKLLDDTRKEMDQVKDTACRTACLSWTTKQLSDPSIGGTIRGEIAVGTPDIKMVPKFPKKGTQEYEAFCTAFGLKREGLDADVFHIHWPHAVEYVSDCIALGKPLPPGIDPATLKMMNNLSLESYQEVDAKMTLRAAKGAKETPF